MNILIYGAGAVGSTIGGMLAKAGHGVHLVGRDPHMKRIRESGLSIRGLWGTHRVQTLRASTELPDEFVPDWIFLTVKAFDTQAAATILQKRFPKSIPILHIQNGVGNADQLIATFGADRVVTAMIIIGFQITLAGQVVVTVQADSIKLGRSPSGKDALVEDMAQVFANAGMPVETVADIQTHLWGKVLYNASLNPLGAILSVNYGKLLEPHPWALIEQIVEEGFRALNADGQRVFWPDAAAYLAHLKGVQVPATFNHQPSMLADVRHGRETEIDFINGALVRLGEKHGIPMPTNTTLVRMIHALEYVGRTADLKKD